ncbi:MAG TPA: hypothetical protein VF480_00455, partial [Verrucomicrobiae bacterium]
GPVAGHAKSLWPFAYGRRRKSLSANFLSIAFGHEAISGQIYITPDPGRNQLFKFGGGEVFLVVVHKANVPLV